MLDAGRLLLVAGRIFGSWFLILKVDLMRLQNQSLAFRVGKIRKAFVISIIRKSSS
jgi:hypothetical protein